MPALADRYDLGRRLGAGGMGEVVEAYDRKLGRRVAIKRLRSELTGASARARFVREVRNAAALSHPNIVTVFDVGDDGDHPYFVMELVEGRTLAEAITADGPLPTDQAARVADAVLAGLGAAHARGLVHRDVKPANVLLGRDGSIKLTDFGIALAVHDATAGLTATGEMVGTPSYLSPEQTRGETVGPPADLYAVGILLYEMLSGAPPFHSDTPIATALAHRDAPVPPLAERRAGVPPQLAAVVERALEKSPSDRFADADSMRAALRAAARPGTAAEATVPGLASPTSVLPTPSSVSPPGRSSPSSPSSPSSGSPGRRRRLVPALVVGALLGALVLAGAFALRGGGGEGRLPVAEAAVREKATTTTVAPTTTTTIPTPRTLGELLAVVAGNPSAYGSRGTELLDQLDEVLNRPDKNGKRAERLMGELSDWMAAGEIDPEVASLAQQLLAPYLAGTSDGDEGDGGDNGWRYPGSDD